MGGSPLTTNPRRARTCCEPDWLLGGDLLETGVDQLIDHLIDIHPTTHQFFGD
jgi:hypothetical protein